MPVLQIGGSHRKSSTGISFHLSQIHTESCEVLYIISVSCPGLFTQSSSVTCILYEIFTAIICPNGLWNCSFPLHPWLQMYVWLLSLQDRQQNSEMFSETLEQTKNFCLLNYLQCNHWPNHHWTIDFNFSGNTYNSIW